MRIALYARVSTADQHPEAQLHALRTYAQARGLEVVGEYVDHGVSGLRAKRPALDQLMADARRRTLDAVAVVKLDRLGRSLTHMLAMLGELEELDVAFVSLDDGIDTSTAAGRLFMQMRGAFAEYEAAMIRERTIAGLEAARRRGAKLGRPAALDERQRARARRLRKAGRSLRQIADVLGASHTTVRRALAG